MHLQALAKHNAPWRLQHALHALHALNLSESPHCLVSCNDHFRSVSGWKLRRWWLSLLGCGSVVLAQWGDGASRLGTWRHRQTRSKIGSSVVLCPQHSAKGMEIVELMATETRQAGDLEIMKAQEYVGLIGVLNILDRGLFQYCSLSPQTRSLDRLACQGGSYDSDLSASDLPRFSSNASLL